MARLPNAWHRERADNCCRAAVGAKQPFCAAVRTAAAACSLCRSLWDGAGQLHPARCSLTTRLVSPSRSQLQAPSSYGPVLSPMNKVHGGGINKLPSVNQLVGQPAQHGSSSAPSLAPMGKVIPSPGTAGRAGRAGRAGSDGQSGQSGQAAVCARRDCSACRGSRQLSGTG